MLPSRLILFCSLAIDTLFSHYYSPFDNLCPWCALSSIAWLASWEDWCVFQPVGEGMILNQHFLFPCKFWGLSIIPEWTLLILTFCRWSWDSWIPETSEKLWDSYPPPWCCPGCRRTCWQSLCKEVDHKWDTREGLFTHTNWHWEDENYRCSCSHSGRNWTSKLPQVFASS